MSGGATGDSLRQGLDLLLTGYGYNFYSRKNAMRADDLLVRQRSAAALGQAAAALAALQAAYQERYVPLPTREQPFPPPEAMARLRLIADLRERLLALAGDLRGMPVPTQDRTWARLRSERALLERLVAFDRAVVGEAEALASEVQGVTAAAWQTGEPGSALVAKAEALAAVLRERRALLAVPD